MSETQRPCPHRGRRHIAQQMAEKQEQRSLQAERWEQEKAQLLGHMEQLHEEDLRVTGGPGHGLPGRGLRGGLTSCQAQARSTGPSPPAFYGHMKRLCGPGARRGEQ